LNSEDLKSQTLVQQNNDNASTTKKITTQEKDHTPSKPISRGQIPVNNDFAALRNFAFNSNVQGYTPGTKSHTKTRKNTGSGSKDRTLSETKPTRYDNTLPQISQNSQRRGVSPLQSFENKSYNTPVKHLQHVQLTTQTISESEKHEENESNEYKEQPKNLPLGHLKSSHPLKEIKIDITNLEQQTTAEPQRSSTSRSKLPAPLFSQRPEKETQEKPIKSIRGATTPQAQGGIVSRANKQRFLVSNPPPKQEVAQKEITKKPNFKNILTDEEKKNYGDRFLEDYEKVDFLGR